LSGVASQTRCSMPSRRASAGAHSPPPPPKSASASESPRSTS
jgi:hypothetical protein